MKNIKRLYSWAIVTKDNGFRAPEDCSHHLTGIYEGDRITSSRIVSYLNRIIFTATGSKYYLAGDPDPKYLAWLEANDIPFDINVPLRYK